MTVEAVHCNWDALTSSKLCEHPGARHWQLGEYVLYCDNADELFSRSRPITNDYSAYLRTPYVKMPFMNIVNGKREAVNPAATARRRPALCSHRPRRPDHYAATATSGSHR